MVPLNLIHLQIVPFKTTIFLLNQITSSTSGIALQWNIVKEKHLSTNVQPYRKVKQESPSWIAIKEGRVDNGNFGKNTWKTKKAGIYYFILILHNVIIVIRESIFIFDCSFSSKVELVVMRLYKFTSCWNRRPE